jgi:hypothetical protein
MRRTASALTIAAVWLAAAADVAAEPPLTLVTASYFGTAGDDDLQGAAVAPDGTLYLVGNAGAPAGKLPGGVEPATFGRPAAAPKCGRGFVAHLSADGTKLLHYAELAEGIAILTSVQVNANGVYASGYAAAALEPLLENIPGLLRQYPLAEDVRLVEEGKIAEANAIKDGKDPLAGRPGLGRYGAPCVLRFSKDLRKFECGTYLEGWQQVWDKLRIMSKLKKQFPVEYSWQPTHLALLRGGDVLVCHDGGYFRHVTDKDREQTAGNAESLRRLAFYDVCDHLSRLSPDLSKRAYRKEIYTPAVDQPTAARLKDGWPHPHYGSPRTLRMRLDAKENAYLCGWSASATSREPYWSPYIWQMDPRDGSLIRKVRETDPMSGKDNRMGGAVADAAIGALAIEEDGNLVFGRYSDGGYSGVIHFSGSIRRVDMRTLEETGMARTVPCVWTVDLAALPGGNLLALGRCNDKVDWTPDAWQQGDPDENPEGWLRVYGPKLDLRFSTALRGIVPYELVPIGDRRWVIVGQAFHTTAAVSSALQEKPRGKRDGYFLIVEAAKSKPQSAAGAVRGSVPLAVAPAVVSAIAPVSVQQGRRPE